MSTLAQIEKDLEAQVERLLPRILTQACRDPNSAAYGAFDRDWWHYRIRDFPSVILQQGAYTAWLAGQLDSRSGQREALTRLAAEGGRFWCTRATRRKAFEEYYPWEEGYAPLAFSTLAVMKLAAAGVVTNDELKAGAVVAARQLLRRFESEAGNQQVAGLAALAWVRKVFPDLVPADKLETIICRTLALQEEEGWFEEYGGPDLAYLSVALDCLWDLWDATGDGRFREAAVRALKFMSRYAAILGGSIGMHNARNTDYILPYGLARFVADGHEEGDLAAFVLAQVYGSVASPEHFIHAIDDRYLCHYSGHSFVRACLLLKKAAARGALPATSPEPDAASELLLESCGHYLKRTPAAEGCSVILSLKKGGILTGVRGESRISDFGWVVGVGDQQYVSHWWSDRWTWERNGNAFTVRGHLVPHREHLSTPWKHMVLRAVSFTAGQAVIPALKRMLIFKSDVSPYGFERRIVIDGARITVTDRITGVPEEAWVRAAPRASKRHVSSADSFHAEDLAMCDGVKAERTEKRAAGVFEAGTTYTLGKSSE